MAIGRYRRDDELLNAKVDADTVRRVAATAVPDAPTQGVLAFLEDVGLTQPVPNQQVVVLQAEQLLGWLTTRPARLTPTQVHQIGSTLDAALPPRDGPRRPFQLPATLTAQRRVGRPGRRPTGDTGRRRLGPAGRSAPGRPGPRRGTLRGPARTAGQELAHGLRRIAVLVALAVLVLFVAVPVASRVLPAVLTHLVQASVSRSTPTAPTPGRTPSAFTCGPAQPVGTPGCGIP